MRSLAAGALAIALGVALGGCPSDAGNPATLFLAPDGSEVRLRLIDHEPPPF